MRFITKTRYAKGQAEFVAILAIVIIALVAIIVALNQLSIFPFAPTTGIEEQQKTIKDSVNNLIKAGIQEILVDIYNQGGYSDPPGNSISFGDTKVPVWQECVDVEIPDVEEEIRSGIESFLIEELGQEMIFFGKKVKFDYSDMKADVRIIPGRIEADIYLKTMVEGYEISMPYSTSFDSDLYGILEFSEAFSQGVNDTKFFEIVTITSALLSNPESGSWVPISGVRTGCFNPFFLSKDQAVQRMDDIIDYTVSHVVWDKATLRSSSNPFYPVNTMKDKRYDLDVEFHYPDWDLRDNMKTSQDPLKIIPKRIKLNQGPISLPMPNFCMDYYGFAYSFRYPVVVSVKDDFNGLVFKFAVMSTVEGNSPSYCETELGESRGENLCKVSDCEIGLRVVDELGRAVPGADVLFHDCDLGKTDSLGMIRSNVPCMISELKVYKEGYKAFGDFNSYSEFDGKEIEIKKVDTVSVHFIGVPMVAYHNEMILAFQIPYSSWREQYPGVFTDYFIVGSPRPISEIRLGDFALTLPLIALFQTNLDESAVVSEVTFAPTDPNPFTGEESEILVSDVPDFETQEIVDEVGIYSINHNTYDITGFARNKFDSNGFVKGVFNMTDFEIKGENELFIYVPVILGYTTSQPSPGSVINPSYLEDPIDIGEINKIRERFHSCGLDFVAMQEMTVESNCIVSSTVS
jgi:hypothetical protein